MLGVQPSEEFWIIGLKDEEPHIPSDSEGRVFVDEHLMHIHERNVEIPRQQTHSSPAFMISLEVELSDCERRTPTEIIVPFSAMSVRTETKAIANSGNRVCSRTVLRSWKLFASQRD